MVDGVWIGKERKGSGTLGIYTKKRYEMSERHKTYCE